MLVLVGEFVDYKKGYVIMFDQFYKLLEEVNNLPKPENKKDLSIHLTDEEKLEIDKSFGDYEPSIAGWTFQWKS